MGENVTKPNSPDESTLNSYYNPETSTCEDPCLIPPATEALVCEPDWTPEPAETLSCVASEPMRPHGCSQYFFGPQLDIPTTPKTESEQRFVSFKKVSPTVENVEDQLRTLASIYETAQQEDPAIARKCQVTAAEYLRFALDNGFEKDQLRALVTPFGIHLPIIKSFSIQIGNVASNYGPGRAATKIVHEVLDEPEHTALFTDSAVTVSPGDWSTHSGLEPFDLTINNKTIGFLIKVQPSSGLQLGYGVEELSHGGAENKGYHLYAAANYSVNTTVPATVSIVNGQPSNLYVAKDMDGIVVIRNGKPEIFNADKTDIYKVMDETMAQQGTMFQANLLVYNGQNTVPQNGSSYNADIRRLLVTFNDGSYGVVQIDDYVDLYEAGQILSKLPGVQHAVNLDTGGSNVAGYQQGDGSYHRTGETEDYGTPVTSATLIYVK